MPVSDAGWVRKVGVHDNRSSIAAAAVRDSYYVTLRIEWRLGRPAYGQLPQAWASDLPAVSEAPVDRIATAVSFGSVVTVCERFGRLVGMSPCPCRHSFRAA